MILRLATIAAMLAVGACSAPTGDASHDYYGNVYPVDCPASIAQDPALLARVTIVRQHVSGARGTAQGNRVTLDPGLAGWMLEDVTRHELCHVIKGDWHARHVPNVYNAPVCSNPFHCN